MRQLSKTLGLVVALAMNAAGPAHADENRGARDTAHHLSARLRFAYVNYSGDGPLLPPGATGGGENLSGDGPGADLFYSGPVVDAGLTFTSVLVAAGSPSYLTGAYVGKSAHVRDWRLSFGLGAGLITLQDASQGDEITQVRVATLLRGSADYFVTDTLFLGLQVQSWIALGPEADLGTAVGSLGAGYDFF